MGRSSPESGQSSDGTNLGRIPLSLSRAETENHKACTRIKQMDLQECNLH